MFVLEGHVGFHKIGQLQFLQHQCLGIDLDYSDVEWFALEMNQDPSVIFEIAPKYCISHFLVDRDGYSISSKGFLPISSVQFSRSVVSDSLRPHESQHARPRCPSPTPGVHSNSHPLSQ